MKCNEHLAKIGSICCQKIIPLVFDQSYSYYEQLCAFATKLNEIICAVNEQNLTIADFENRISTAFQQYKSEMNLAFADFQIEVNQKIDEFTTEIRDEWRIYRETLNLEFTELKNANQQFKTDMQTAWASYQTQINSTINNFMTAETTARTNFETTQSQRQNNFETAQTTRQTNFENNLTSDWEEFQEEIAAELANVSSKNRLSYYGALRPVTAGSSTDWPFIDNPIDSVQGLNFANNLVSVYTHDATAHNYKFLKRQKFGALSTDGDIPAPSRSAPVMIVFDNPVTNLFFAYGADLTFTGSGVDGSGNNRLIIGAFPRISDTMSFTDTGYTALAEYSAHGITDHTLTPYSTPYPIQPSYYAIAFLFSGVNYGVKVTQPTTATSQRRIMPGLLYDAFTGEFMRDPQIIQNQTYISEIRTELTRQQFTTDTDLNTITTPGNYYGNIANYTFTNLPSDLTNGTFTVLVVRATAGNRFYQILISWTNNDDIYIRNVTATATPTVTPWRKVTGGGSGATITSLWSLATGAVVNTEYALNDSINNYDAIYLKISTDNDISLSNTFATTSFLTAFYDITQAVEWQGFLQRALTAKFNGNKFTQIVSTSTEGFAYAPKIYQIIGVKF